LFETWYEGLAAPQGSAEQRKYWADLLAIRTAAARLLEGMRNASAIGASLQAEVTVYADAATRARFAEVADELQFFFITSELSFVDVAEKVEDAHHVEIDGADVWVAARPSTETKCIRCWHYRPDVGLNPEHPEICGRCVSNIEGPGEDRRWF
jgi:isoleucyl-tRNA synthetase